jgi:hypothetical protein
MKTNMTRSSIYVAILALTLFPSACIAQAQLAKDSAEREHPVRVTSLPQKDFSDWLAWGGGLLLVLIGGVGVGLALRTVKAIEKQAAAQMDADRAWVLVNAVSNPLDPIYSSERPTYTPGIVFMVEIVGNTPAKIVRESFRCRIVPAIEGSRPPKPVLETAPDYRPEKMFEGSAVYPPTYKYNLSVQLESGPLSADQFARLRDGKDVLCAYGLIEYLDAFKRKGTTQVGVVYNFAFGGVFTSPDGTVLNQPGFRFGGPKGYNEVT